MDRPEAWRSGTYRRSVRCWSDFEGLLRLWELERANLNKHTNAFGELEGRATVNKRGGFVFISQLLQSMTSNQMVTSRGNHLRRMNARTHRLGFSCAIAKRPTSTCPATSHCPLFRIAGTANKQVNGCSTLNFACLSTRHLDPACEQSSMAGTNPSIKHTPAGHTWRCYLAGRLAEAHQPHHW
ncbi:hypothetical protein VTI74DRAFT_7790 [Chaetomium olivicolor]